MAQIKQNKQAQNKRFATTLSREELDMLKKMKKDMMREERRVENLSNKEDLSADEVDEILENPEKFSMNDNDKVIEIESKKRKVIDWVIAIGSGLALIASGILAGMAIAKGGKHGE